MESRDDLPRFNPLDHPIAFEAPLHVDGIGWEEHIPFAMTMVDVLRPGRLVELGVHSGDSYLAFCQAVERLGTGTTCRGVDTWKGDAHAGFYGGQVLAALRPQHAPYEKFSTLMQMTFDEALDQTEDGSVDLLHIDGFHTYESSKHDFETWLPKVSDRGVVLFHDVCEKGREFGVWKLWAELGEKYPAFTFEHGHGLGVLFAGEKSRAGAFFEATQDLARAAALRGFYSALGGAVGARVRERRAHVALQQHAATGGPGISARLEREWDALKTRIAAIDALVRAKK